MSMGTISLIWVVNTAFEVYSWLIIARVVLSWIRHDPYHPVIRFIYEVTDPYLNLFRRIVPPAGILDLSPFVALLAMHYLIRPLVIGLLSYCSTLVGGRVI